MIRYKKIINFQNKDLFTLSPVFNRIPVMQAVFFYGSRVHEQHTDLSDIDLFYLSEENINLTDEAEILYQINKLIHTTEVDFTSIKNLPLKVQYDILTQGQVIYSRNEEFITDYKEFIIIKYFDFKPVYDEYMSCFKNNMHSGEILK